MVQARSELVAGDRRLLYLAWLLAVQSDEVDDEATEPPVPAGLAELSARLQAVVDFLEIDEDLIDVAVEASPPVEDARGLGGVDRVPCRGREGRTARAGRWWGRRAVQALLLRHFRAVGGTAPTAAGRTAAELWQAASDRKEAREKAAEARRRKAEARRAAAEAAAYAKRLDELATRTEAAWQEAAELIETRKPRDYDLATSLLRDLQALAERQEDSAAFRQRFLSLRAQHERKPSLQERFDQAGLP